MKEPRIAYFPPGTNSWEQMMEHAINDDSKITMLELEPIIDTFEVDIYTLTEFIKAFNEERISDQGVILQIGVI